MEELLYGLVDEHPGSDGLVVDLVHPSLYAYERGQSAVLRSGGGADRTVAPPWKDFIGSSQNCVESPMDAGDDADSNVPHQST